MKRQWNATGLPGPRAVCARLPFFQHNKTFPADRCSFAKSSILRTLVGDLVDGWQLKRSWYWTQPYNDVIQKVLRKVRKGTQVIYIPGNHDEFARDFEGLQFGGITILKEAIHETANGKRLLVLHGDEFDGIAHYARWLAFLGSYGYDLILLLTYWINKLRRKTGVGQRSLAAFLKGKVKNIMKFISDYETALVREARKRGADGVVCGHIHKADLREIDGMIYGNTDDWVESCSALVEREDGCLEIIHCFHERTYRQEDILPSALPPLNESAKTSSNFLTSPQSPHDLFTNVF